MTHLFWCWSSASGYCFRFVLDLAAMRAARWTSTTRLTDLLVRCDVVGPVARRLWLLLDVVGRGGFEARKEEAEEEEEEEEEAEKEEVKATTEQSRLERMVAAEALRTTSAASPPACAQSSAFARA